MTREEFPVAELSVLRACLNALNIGTKQVVLSETTTPTFGLSTDEFAERLAAYVLKNLQGILDETLQDFLAKNKRRHPISPELAMDDRVVCIDEQEVLRILQDGEWRVFKEMHPYSHGYIEFSRVGLDTKLSQGLLYVGWRIGPLAGDGHLRLFGNSDSGWTLVESTIAWVS